MKLRSRTFLVLSLCVALWLIPSAANAQRMTWTIDGVQREALVFPPKNAGTGKVPVVFGFHWHGGTMQQDTRVFRFQKVWPEAIVVYMQGLATRASRAGDSGWQHAMGEFDDRDLKFLDAVLASLREKYPIDDRRIYGSGFSDGAGFTYFLWSARADTFAAFAIVAGRMDPSVRLTVPKPVYYSVGKMDRGFQEIMQVVDTVRDLNGTSASGEPCGEDCTLYSSSKGAPVVAYIHPHGHVYPLPISDKFVEFFKRHARAD